MALLKLVVRVIATFAFLQLIRWLRNRFTRISISYLSGPPKSHWLLGNLPDLDLKDVGVSHLSWQEKYGSVFKVHGFFGEQYLMTSDQKAIQHIYSSTYMFGRQAPNEKLLKVIIGPGIITVNGDDHKRQRRVMQPAFGTSHLKALFPVFSRHCDNLSSVMKREIDAGIDRQRATVNVYEYSARGGLDIIGDAAYDYQFGALEKKQNQLREAFHKLGAAQRNENKFEIFLLFAIGRLPSSLIIPFTYLPIRKLTTLRTTRETLDAIAEQLITDKTDALTKGLEGGKDLMSLLVRANFDQEQKAKLSDLEVRSEISTITAAAQGPSSSTMAFALWELAKDIDLQCRIRQEISQTLQRVQQRGETVITFDDYDGMSLLVAFIKEVLRWHPVVFGGAKEALVDTSIPLSKPVKLGSGQTVDEIPISKGQKILVNIPGYNRSPEIFGDNSHEFNVDRWLNDNNIEKQRQGVGIYAGLITFGHGPKACIGWRFFLFQAQMMLISMISNFEFTLPKGGKVRRTPAGSMVPTIEGDKDLKAALLLDVSIL